jgi:phospholipase C
MKNAIAIPLLLSAAAANAQVQTTTPIKHVVVIFQENVSFDHYFATYPSAANSAGEPVFTASPNTPSVNGLNGGLLTSNPNSTQPFRLTRAQAVTCDQDHNYADEQASFNNGLMNRFVETVGSSSLSCDVAGLGKKIVMGYYDGNTVTAIWNYAQNYAMSDNSFGTVFGPSTPGALNVTSGQTHGATAVRGNPDIIAGSVFGDPRPTYDDCVASTLATISMSGKNIGDVLNAQGITWGWFQGGFRPTSMNADGTAVCGAQHTNIAGGSSADYIPHHEPFQYFQSTSNPHHLPPSSAAMIGQTDQANHQYDLADFFTALNSSVLPAVSYVKAAAYQDGHAGYSDPLDEQAFLVNTINAILQSRYWNNTVIFIAYDDSDGWYDHVMPPIVMQSSTAKDNLNAIGSCGNPIPGVYQGRCGYGPRLPLLAISPYAKVNYVDHSTSDQSSILRFVEDNWNLGRMGDQSFDALAGSLMGMFNFQGSGSASKLILDPATGLPAGSSTAGPVAVVATKNVSTVAKQIQLDGSASTSSDGKPLSYSWQVVAGSPSASITGGISANPSVQFDSGFGAYIFQLTVTDSTGRTASDTTTISYLGR